MTESSLLELKSMIIREKKIIQEIAPLPKILERTNDDEERTFISSQMNSLKKYLKKTNEEILKELDKISLIRTLPSPAIQRKPIKQIPIKLSPKIKPSKKTKLTELEKETLKRLKKRKEKIKEQKMKKQSKYVKIASRIFSKLSISLADKNMFKTMRRDLIKADLQFIPTNYISVILFTTFLSAIAGVFIFFFFLFFNISATLPIIIPVDEEITSRILKVFWILFAVPLGTFLFAYLYQIGRASCRERV